MLEYEIIRKEFAVLGKRTISPKDVIGKEENRLWLGMATAVVEFESATGTELTWSKENPDRGFNTRFHLNKRKEFDRKDDGFRINQQED